MTPPVLRRRYRDCFLTNLSILTIVISASLVVLIYNIDSLETGGPAAFFMQLLFYAGLTAASFFSLGIPAAVCGEGRRSIIRVLSLFAVIIFAVQQVSFVVIFFTGRADGLMHLNGIFQLAILAFFFVSLGRTAVILSLNWKSGSPLLRVGLPFVFILFILAVIAVDLAYGVWSKIESGRELSLFYLFPAFLTVLSILISLITVILSRRQGRAGIDKGDALKAYGLSPRELEVALLISRGSSYREAADTLCISLATVQSHIKSIYRKTGVNSKIELVNLGGIT